MNVCEPNEFRCDDGICIADYKICNKIFDCTDRSDESQCNQQPNEDPFGIEQIIHLFNFIVYNTLF
jgi:hypothetical protein